MRNINLDSSCKLIPAAKERIYKGNRKISVLLIHGFTGSPNDMVYLAENIYQETNYTVYIPRLPGHGTNSKDFKQSNARDWIRKVYDSYINLINEYKTVYVGGLSMGGLLSILTASQFKVKKLFLIAAALYAHNKLLPLSHIIKFIIPVISNEVSPDPNKYDTDDELQIYNNYWKDHYTAQTAELHKIMKLARKKLSTVKSDTLIIASRTDEQVPMKAAYTIKNKITSQNKRLFIFENSPHVINNGPEKKNCAEQIINFLTD